MNAAIINDIKYTKYSLPGTEGGIAQLLATTTVGAGVVSIYTAAGLSTATFFRRATLIAQKSLDGSSGSVSNTGNVLLGYDSGAGKQPILLKPGDTWDISAPVGAKQSFADVYIKVATDNDGVVVIYS